MTVRGDVSVNWDVSPRIITVLADSDEMKIQDLHDTCRYLEDQPDTLVFDYLVDSTGKEPLGGEVYVGVTMVLNNAKLAFEARDPPTFVQCNVLGGNLTAVDENGADMDPVQTTAYTQVVRTSSSSATLQESGTSGLTSEESEALDRIDTNVQEVQTQVLFIEDIEAGRWEIVNSQMIFYKADNITEVARFNLLDEDGNPSNEKVFERVRVS